MQALKGAPTSLCTFLATVQSPLALSICSQPLPVQHCSCLITFSASRPPKHSGQLFDCVVMPPFKSPTTTFHNDTYPSISPSLRRLSTTGKSAIVTGAGTGGIGAATALSLARSGISSLALLGRSEPRLQETKRAVEAISSKTAVHIYIADLTSAAAVHTAVAAFATAVGGSVNILISKAGYMPDVGTVANTDPAEWWRGFEINVLGNLHLLQAFLLVAARKGQGKEGASVVYVSSAAIYWPFLAGFSSYRTSKVAATKLFKMAAGENPDLFVLQVYPGLT